MEEGASGLLLTPKSEVDGYVESIEIGEASTSTAASSLRSRAGHGDRRANASDACAPSTPRTCRDGVREDADLRNPDHDGGLARLA
ncbi:hypothetical protein [Streptomyces sp. NPDC006285]|uniref:hypothetical protein n=1 Tax=Streptomyces sp. NPDC006285 TaxID=3364742 RepID=UPI0036D19DBD